MANRSKRSQVRPAEVAPAVRPHELDEDWQLLLSLLPAGWKEQAVLTGAVERLRGFSSTGDLLRTLLLHVGLGHSYRQSSVFSKASKLAIVSDVALLKRLRNAGDWWRWMCAKLLEEQGWELPPQPGDWRVRAVDGTLVRGPGQNGKQWRIHYSLRIPSLECDHLQLTPVVGPGNGEKLERYTAQTRDLFLADRVYAKPGGIAALTAQGAAMIVRLNTGTLPLFEADGKPFALLDRLQTVDTVGRLAEWEVYVHADRERIKGRLCVVRKSEQATRQEQRKIRRKAQQGGPKTKPETFKYAAFVMVFTTLPVGQFDTAQVLDWYRTRWQVELSFKRLKSLADLGHLPKKNEAGMRAWLYGKLLIALLGQKLGRIGRDISPWGYRFWKLQKQERLAGV